MGKIDIFRNGSVTSRNASLHTVQAVGECILPRRGSDALFANDFGEDFF